MLVQGPDGEMVECEVISTKDHESFWTKNAPVLPLPFAIICCILNIVPGWVFTKAQWAKCPLLTHEKSLCLFWARKFENSTKMAAPKFKKSTFLGPEICIKFWIL